MPSEPVQESRFGNRPSHLLLFLPLALGLAGCGTSCFFGIINPPNSGVGVVTGNVPSVCSPKQTTAAVEVVAEVAPPCTNCTAAQQITHVSLAISGVQFHPGFIADEDSPDWQELAPRLARNPQHADLVVDPVSHQFVLPLTVAGHLTAGHYYQVRLRLAATSSLQSADGRFHALTSPDHNSYVTLQFAAPFIVSSDRANELRLELYPEGGLSKSSAGTLESAPALRGQLAVAGKTSLAN